MTNWKTKIKIWLYKKLDPQEKGYLTGSDIIDGIVILSVILFFIVGYALFVIFTYSNGMFIWIPLIIIPILILVHITFRKTKIISYNKEDTVFNNENTKDNEDTFI